MSNKKCLMLAAIVLLLAPVAAFGEVIAYDGFEYTAGSSLAGNDGGSGWAAAWVNRTTTGTSTISSGSLTDDSGNCVNVAGSSDGFHCVYRMLGTTITAENHDTIYVSFLAQQTNTTQRIWALSLANVNGSTHNIGVQIGSSNDTANYTIYTEQDYSGTRTVSDVSAETLCLTVTSINLDTGVVGLYLFDDLDNVPASMDGLTPAATFTYSDIVVDGGYNAFRLAAGSTNSSDGVYPTYSVDELRISTTWSEAVGVPEPSTIAMLACGLLGLLAYAWRKRK